MTAVPDGWNYAARKPQAICHGDALAGLVTLVEYAATEQSANPIEEAP